MLAAMLGALLIAAPLALALPTQTVSLDGRWKMAQDPFKDGEASGWLRADYDDREWDPVSVPGSWMTDPRFQYTGTMFYRRRFTAPEPDGKTVRLRFEAVFARAKVWLNGKLLGTHEGPYTPFEFDVTAALKPGAENLLVVAADNTWTTKTLPGARPGTRAAAKVYPYYSWGGIIRPVQLLLTPPVYVERTHIQAEPDLTGGPARLSIRAWVKNASPAAAEAEVSAAIQGARVAPVKVTVAAGTTRVVELTGEMPAAAVKLWDQDHPNLYNAAVGVRAGEWAHEKKDRFGIRRVEVRGERLLLNGEPIRMGGANRASDHPVFGAGDPQEVVELDGKLLKGAGLELARLQHYAIAPNLLDWADENGILIIAEAAAWGLVPEQLDDAEVRATFQEQQREMIGRDANHPSIIAWSVGNEYASDTPAGVSWTKDMYAFTKQLDAGRPVTFAGFRGDRTEAPPAAEGSAYVDFVMINVYGSPEQLAQRLDKLHERCPGKPILISEYGIRADGVGDESERSKWFLDTLEAFRKRPWIAGMSVWSFNDYRSRYPGTNPNGYRQWGLIDDQRKPRGAYFTLQREFSPAFIGKQDGHRVSITGRGDFPHYTARDYRLRYLLLDRDGNAVLQGAAAVPVVRPGETVTVELPKAAGAVSCRLQLMRPTGHTAGEERTISLP